MNDVNLLPTQESKECENEASFDDENIWGKLLPLSSPFIAHNLIEVQYTFGRNPENGVICFPQLHDQAFYLEHSKIHCQLKRKTRENSKEQETVLCDLSSNGTYINGKVIGKHVCRLLHGGDEISFARAVPKRYLFVETAQQHNFSPDILAKFHISRTLGRGACGEVFLAVDKSTERRIAIKRVQMTKVTDANYLETIKEAELMRQVQHPCIVQLIDVVHYENWMFISMEVAEGGELFDRILNNGAMSCPQAKEISYQMLLALKFLHDSKIVHRDLKPENILLSNTTTDNCVIKMTDFGLSKLFIGDDAQTPISLKTYCGTLHYMAPEVHASRGTKKYTSKVDIWSLGCIIHIILLGSQPFGRSANDDEGELEAEIAKGFIPHNEDLWKKIDNQAKDLIRKMLKVDPVKRLNADECINHPWFIDRVMKERVAALLKEEALALSVEVPQVYPYGVNVENIIIANNNNNLNRSSATNNKKTVNDDIVVALNKFEDEPVAKKQCIDENP